MLRALRHLTKVTAGTAGYLLLAASPAWADQSQLSVCDFGQKGRTFWRLAEEVDEIAGFHGIWEHRNGGSLVHSEWQYAGFEGPVNIEIYGQGTHEWALWGVVVQDDDWLTRGTRCEGDANLANLVNNAVPGASAGRLTPPPLTITVPDTYKYVGPLIDPH